MKVKELIKELKKYNGNAEVVFQHVGSEYTTYYKTDCYIEGDDNHVIIPSGGLSNYDRY